MIGLGALRSRGFVNLVEPGRLHPAVSFTRGSTGTYFGADGLLKSAASNAPRFGYDPVTLAFRGLLIEEQRTNLALRSQEFDQAVWVKVNGSVSANAAAAPDGTATADLFSEDSSIGAHGMDESITVAAGLQTISVFVRYAGRQWIRIDPYGSASPGTDAVWFDIQNGVKGSQQANCAGTISAVGSGWYRITWTANCVAGSLQISLRGASADNSTSNYTGSGAAAFYVWGAQLEAGNFATSYIPTAGAAQTRSADLPSISNVSAFGYNPSEGTFFVEAVQPPAQGATFNPTFFAVSDGTGSNRCQARYEVGGNISGGVILSGGVSQAALGPGIGALSPLASIRLATALKANDFAAVTNGGAPAADNSGVMPIGINRLEIGYFLNSQHFNGWIRRLRHYPRRLPNSELQALTA